MESKLCSASLLEANQGSTIKALLGQPVLEDNDWALNQQKDGQEHQTEKEEI